jgi:sulfur-oxidizing protein SoxZ
MAMIARLQVPGEARRGEVIEVRLAIQHPMETGFRRDDAGTRIAQNVINRLVCRFGGREVFSAEMGSGVAANPYLQFPVRIAASGLLEIEWQDDTGERGQVSARIEVRD